MEGYQAYGPRSVTTVILKNLPASTRHSNVQSLVRMYGPTRKILIPPSGLFAVVKYQNEADAASALHGLAYSRYGSSIVYAEMASSTFWEAECISTQDIRKPKDNETACMELGKGSSRLHIKSFAVSAFKTSPQDIFSSTAIGNEGAPLGEQGIMAVSPRSLGYDLVSYEQQAAASLAGKRTDGYTPEGHVCKVSLADQREEVTTSEQSTATHTASKLIIKNLPFEISRSGLRDLLR